MSVKGMESRYRILRTVIYAVLCLRLQLTLERETRRAICLEGSTASLALEAIDVSSVADLIFLAFFDD